MSADELQRFLNDLDSSNSLREEVAALGSATDAGFEVAMPALLAFGRERGYRVTEEDAAVCAPSAGEPLSEKELERVAGGRLPVNMFRWLQLPALDGSSKDPAYMTIKIDPERIR